MAVKIMTIDIPMVINMEMIATIIKTTIGIVMTITIKKRAYVDIQKLKCVNSNINVNGIDITQIPQDPTALAAANEGGTAEAANTQNGNGYGDGINFDRNLVNVCVNVNDNEQIKVSPPSDEEPNPNITWTWLVG